MINSNHKAGYGPEFAVGYSSIGASHSGLSPLSHLDCTLRRPSPTIKINHKAPSQLH